MMKLCRNKIIKKGFMDHQKRLRKITDDCLRIRMKRASIFQQELD